MKFTFLLKSIYLFIGMITLNFSFSQNTIIEQPKAHKSEKRPHMESSDIVADFLNKDANVSLDAKPISDTLPKFSKTNLEKNKVINSKFKDFEILNINSAAMLRDAKSSTRSEVYNMSLGVDGSIKVSVKPSNILSENYSTLISDENGIKEVRGFTAIPMVGKVNDVENSKVSLTINDNFIYGFIKLGFDYYNIEPLYHFIDNAPLDTYIFYSSKDIIQTKNMTCGFEEMQKGEKGAIDRITTGGNRMQGSCFTVLYAIASDFSMFQKYGSIIAVQNHNIGVMNDIQTNYDDEFADEVKFQINQQWISTCASCDPWSNSTAPGVLLGSFRSWGPTGFTQTHNLASLWTAREFDGTTVGMAYINALCNNSRYNVLEDYTTNASSKRVLVAHEVGHNFGASHDDAGSGTIMAPTVNNTNSWSVQSKTSIQAGYLNATCLGTCGSSSAATPTNVQASDGAFTDKVRITWSGTSGNYFRVYRNTINVNSSATPLGNWQISTTYDDLSATAGTTYYYFVRAASNSSGASMSAFSTGDSGLRSAAPLVTTPTSVDASDGTYTDKVRITWSGTSGNFFRIIRNTANSTSAGTVISNWQNTQLYFDDLSAMAGATYFYFVQAASSSAGANASSYSLINSGYRSTAPVVTTPSSVNASDGTYSDKVRITWSGTSGNFFRVIRNTSNSTSAGTVISNWQNTQLVFDDLSAAAGTTYYYFVQAASSSTGSNASSYSLINSGYRSTAPVVTIPSSVNASDGTYSDKVRITWSGTSGNFFRVIRNTSNSTSTGTVISNWQNSQFFYDDFSAAAGTTYYYFIQAASSSTGANASSYSLINSGYRITAPVVTIPSSVNASDGTYSDKVRITWSGTSGNFFRVIRNTSNSTSAGTVISNWQNSQFFYDDFSAAAGTTYYYFIQAASSNAGTNASSYSLINSGYRSTAPVVTIPSSVNASDGTYSDKVRITWSGTFGNYFRIYRGTTSSSFSCLPICNWQNTQSFFDDFSAVPGTTYFYFVQAASSIDGANESNLSTYNSGYRITAPVVTIPSSVNASDGTYSDKVRITWSGTSGNFFRVIRNTSNSTSAGTVISNWQNTQLFYDDLTALAGTTYYYFVQAASSSTGANASIYSAINSGYRIIAPIVTVPSNVNASDGTYSDKVRITWSGTSGNYFRIYRGTTSSSVSCLPICNWQNTQLFFDDFSAVPGTTYYYFVQAASASDGTNQSYLSTNNSGWRSGVSCGTVSNFTVSQITSNSAKLSWNVSNGASQYSIWYNNNSTWTEIGKASQNSATVSGLRSGSRYCFAIKAVCGSTTGNFSNSICLNTLASNTAFNSINVSNDESESISVHESTTVQVNIYPNPVPINANLILEFSSDLENNSTLLLMNATGNVILKVEVPVTIGANTFQIPAPETPGMYICQMLTGKQTLFVRKIMVSEN